MESTEEENAFNEYLGKVYRAIDDSILKTSPKVHMDNELMNKPLFIDFCLKNVTRVKTGKKVKYYLFYNNFATPRILLLKSKEELGVFEERMRYYFRYES